MASVILIYLARISKWRRDSRIGRRIIHARSILGCTCASYERQTCTCCPYGHTDTRGKRVHRRFVNAHVFYTALSGNAPRTVFSLLCCSSHSKFTSNLHLLIPIDFTNSKIYYVCDKFATLRNYLLWKEKKNRLDHISVIDLMEKVRTYWKTYVSDSGELCICIWYFEYCEKCYSIRWFIEFKCSIE